MRELPVRRLDTGDLAACLRLAVEREWRPEEHKWRLLFEIGDVYGIDDPDGGLAGTVICTPYGDEVAAISMMLVAKRFERRGLGGRLMSHAMERAGTATICLTATEYGRTLYERLGFRGISRCTTYSGQLRREPVDGSRPATASDLSEIFALDAEVFGAPRTELLTRLPDFAEEIWVADGADGIAGYGAAWRNIDEAVIGPVIAQDTATALALISDLSAAVDGPVRLELDHRHPALIAWAADHGLVNRFSTVVMECGKPLPCDATRLFNPVMQALS
ncbi:GNAT family N-acetyltransferase [Streptosporangium sp. KLBMP 9127]|nr:GNAT family N-acetyltransferase [Streptosporangium sp. KLBMP 9127]